MSDSVRPHRRPPTRLLCPWDSPGKNTGVGCHFLLQCMKVKSESEVAQSCPTLSDPTDCSLPGSSIHGIFQARVLEWGAIAFSDLELQLFSINSLNTILISLLLYHWLDFRIKHMKRCSTSLIIREMQIKTNVRYHAAAAAKSLQSCLTLCDPIDGSPPGFPVPGILQARTLKCVAISFSNA